jgi:hypothetical protein
MLIVFAASSLEGGRQPDGSLPHKQCIYWKQNQLGGLIYWSYSKLFDLQPGQPYIIRVVPGCSGVTKRALLPRQPDNVIQARASSTSAATATQFAQSSTDWIQNPQPGAKNGTGYILVPIADAQAGDYNLQLGLTGSAQGVSITDGDGTEYALYVLQHNRFPWLHTNDMPPQ